jgi:hypothetical protein
MKKEFILSVLILFFIFSCGGSANEKSIDPASTGFNNNEYAPAPPQGQAIQDGSVVKEEIIKKKIIKTANLSAEVKSFNKARALLDPLLLKHQANISSEKQNNTDYELSTTIIIRLKSEHFDALLNEISGIAFKINSKEVLTDNVTEEFIDITARLKNKKEVEQQYLAILKKANTISEILEVNEHLRIIREEIDSKEGRLKYLENQVSFSTINLYMYERSEQAYKGFGQKLIEGLEGGWKGILGLFIALAYLWPLIIFILAVLWFIIRLRKKRNSLKKINGDF